MFGLEYVLALVKVFFQIAFALVTALPAKLAWNCIAPIYLSFLLLVLLLLLFVKTLPNIGIYSLKFIKLFLIGIWLLYFLFVLSLVSKLRN